MRSSYFCLSFLCAILIGCSPIYVPNVRNVPVFTSAGEVQGKIFLSPLVGVGGYGFDALGAVSVTNHIAVTGGYSNSRNLRNDSTSNSNPYFKHQSYEVGGGYFVNFRKKHVFEVFAGYGAGKGESYIEYDDVIPGDPTIFHYNRLYLQPTYGLVLKNVSIAFSVRASQVNFTDYNSNKIKYTLNKSMYFFEPAATFKAAFPESEMAIFSHLILSAQLGFNLKTSGSNENSVNYNYQAFENKVRYTHFGAALGIGFRFGGNKKEN